MAEHFDAVVIGSGFGGSVSACRLAEKGLSVLVLERGRRWKPEEYPSVTSDNWIWDNNNPEKDNGWIDFRYFGDMSVIQGAAVGGGSLIYANVVIDAKPNAFETGWPKEITFEALQPYYDKVGQMMSTNPIPDGQDTARYILMKEGAEKIGSGDRFEKVDLAVSFDDSLDIPPGTELSKDKSKTFTNQFGMEQGTCIHCGNCDIGCEVRAKNTLDLNYLPQAEKHGAQIRPLHHVTRITPVDQGYKIDFEQLDSNKKVNGYVTAKKVIVAAGSLGSTEILLRNKYEYKTLPQISDKLGHGWCSNGDFLTPSYHEDREISPTHGPTITCAINHLENQPEGAPRYYVEDGGVPDLFENYFHALQKHPFWKKLFARYASEMDQKALNEQDPLKHWMPWFGQAMDASDGVFSLKRVWYAPWRKKLNLDWNYEASQKAVDGLANSHLDLAKATNGKAMTPPTWSLLKDLVTPHPLGGCNMGTSKSNGVVNAYGEVFGYEGLYVLDGAIIPKALGLNPSKTIAAIAEHSMANFQQ